MNWRRSSSNAWGNRSLFQMDNANSKSNTWKNNTHWKSTNASWKSNVMLSNNITWNSNVPRDIPMHLDSGVMLWRTANKLCMMKTMKSNFLFNLVHIKSSLSALTNSLTNLVLKINKKLVLLRLILIFIILLF